MVPLTLAEVAAAVGGQVHGVDGDGHDVLVTGPVVVDSRAAVPGALFVALPGERTDGADHAPDAVRRGAVAVLSLRPLDAPGVVVADGVAALGDLAAAVRDRLPALVIGVTGSSGKTSTKDLLVQLLEAAGPTVGPPGSLNNEIGVPLTLLAADTTTRFLVLEMGARGAGHVAYLCARTRPDIGVVLNVGAAHVGEFGGRLGVAAAKGEMVESLSAEGTAVLNADDPLVRPMAARTQARVLLFGESGDADVRATDVVLDGEGRPAFTLHAPDGSAPVRLDLVGEHHVSNALAAAAVAHAARIPVAAAAQALTAARSRSRWRMEVHHRDDGVTVVNDAYNANPDSVRAALKALVAMAGGRRTWAVLGEMLELGAETIAEHDAVGRLAVRLDVSHLVAVGPGARTIHLGAAQEGSWADESAWVPDREAAVALLRERLRPGDIVLVKASRGAGLETVAQALLDEPSGDAAP